VNFTWFASAYDTDDVIYRLITLLQMAGVLVFAAGIPTAFKHLDFTTVLAGYIIMRLALVTRGYALLAVIRQAAPARCGTRQVSPWSSSAGSAGSTCMAQPA
jgi:low temperature requirement protein LtrA